MGKGGECRLEGRHSTLWGPGRRQEPGRRQAGSRNSLPSLSVAAVVQAMPSAQCVLRKRTCVFCDRAVRSQCRCVLSRPPAVADSCPTNVGQSCQRMGFLDVLGKETPRAERQRQTGRHAFNVLGPATCLQAVAPTGISRRDSLPPLNAMPVVQVSQAVQRVLRNRDVVDAGRLGERCEVQGLTHNAGALGSAGRGASSLGKRQRCLLRG